MKPLPPDVLADALQDRVHATSGRLISSAPVGGKGDSAAPAPKCSACGARVPTKRALGREWCADCFPCAVGESPKQPNTVKEKRDA